MWIFWPPFFGMPHFGALWDFLDIFWSPRFVFLKKMGIFGSKHQNQQPNHSRFAGLRWVDDWRFTPKKGGWDCGDGVPKNPSPINSPLGTVPCDSCRIGGGHYVEMTKPVYFRFASGNIPHQQWIPQMVLWTMYLHLLLRLFIYIYAVYIYISIL